MAACLLIEVAYASPSHSAVKAYRFDAPASVAAALLRAAADPAFAGIDFEHCTVGVFGRIVGTDQPLADGDRVEIYRALAEDPKSARRRRAARSAGRR